MFNTSNSFAIKHIFIFIEEAIFSVLNQSFSDFEILVTDDGGTDDTGLIVNRLSELDSRIRFFPKTNGGIGSACNYMLSFAKGEYALQLDGDDILAPDTIEKMVEVLDNSPIGFVYGDAFLVDKNYSVSTILEAITSKLQQTKGCSIVKKLTPFDVYVGEDLPEGKKSITLNVVMQDPNKTLKDSELEVACSGIVKLAEAVEGVSFRS